MLLSIPMADILKWWLLFSQCVMVCYAAICRFFPEKAITIFTGNKSSVYFNGELEITKRIGILYVYSSIIGFIIIYDSPEMYQTLCILNAFYSFSLCLLIREKQTYWDNSGILKNMPFIMINLMFAFLY